MLHNLFSRFLMYLRAFLRFVFLSFWPVAVFAANNPIQIVCTTGMVGDIVQNVAGERAKVETLMGAGVDPHLYKPTRSDIAKLSSADMVFYSGLMLEGKFGDALVRVATSGRKVFAVTELLPEDFLLEPPEFQGHFDPHVWMDPQAWSKAVEVVRDRLIQHEPQSTQIFQKNAALYLEKLRDLDLYTKRILDSVPKESRVLVTAHDAFNYFGRRYGFEVVGIQGISTESEAGVRDIEKLVELLVTRKIKAVFVESTVSERNMRALIAGAEAKGHKVEIGAKLFSDAMGTPGSYEGTYLGMIDHNVSSIARALGGNAPLNGMLHKLKTPGV